MAFLLNKVQIIPKKSLESCKYLGCPKFTEEKYCMKHKKINIKERATATKCSYDNKWRTARNRLLKVNSLCGRYKDESILVKVTVVSHAK